MVDYFCIERPLQQLSYRYAKFVARHPYKFLLIPLIVSLICSAGIMRRTTVNDYRYLYTPKTSPSIKEREAFLELFPPKSGSFDPEKIVDDTRRVAIVAMASDGGNILRRPFSKAMESLNNFATDSVKITVNGTEYGYRDLCLKTKQNRCFMNEGLKLVNYLYLHHPKNLTFPTVKLGSKRIYLASALGDVDTYTNKTVKSARAWLMVYQLQWETPILSDLSAQWEREFERQFVNYTEPLLLFTYFHSQTVDDELKRTEAKLRPKFATIFIVLLTFAIICNTSLYSTWPFAIDWVLSKPFVAVCGIFNAGMGVGTGIGLLSWFKYEYSDVVAVAPILVISIGAEYMFLMTGAFRRTSRLDSLENRLAESVSLHAVSILIAMLTGAIAFGVGAITEIPAVEIFCVYACVSLLASMFYQFTFFIAVLTVSGKLEAEGRHCLMPMFKCVTDDFEKQSILVKLFCMGSKPNKNESLCHTKGSFVDQFFENWYTPILMHKWVKGVAIMWLILYLIGGIFGCVYLRQGLRLVDILPEDSYAVPYYYAIEKYFWAYGPQVQVLVANPPDLSTTKGQNRALALMNDLSNNYHSVGVDSVKFWLPNYLNFNKQLNIGDLDSEQFYTRLNDSFLNLNSYGGWTTDILWNRNTNCSCAQVSTYRFTMGIRNFGTTAEQIETVVQLRKIANSYADMNVSTFMWLFPVIDQYQLVLPNTLENIAIALVLMICVSIVLIPHPLCSVCVALAIVSIDVGVIGYMTLWKINLDTVSMITVVMSVGFSVDFTAHISYGYLALSHGSKTSLEKMQIALGARAWPCIQAALATLFGMLALSDVDTYLVTTFSKTVFLVMVIGLLHAIVFLPVVLALMFEPIMSLKTTRKIATEKLKNVKISQVQLCDSQ